MSAESVHRVTNQADSAGLAQRLAARRENYDLTAVAGRLLYDPAKKAEEQHRTCWCHRALKSDGGNGEGLGHIYRRVDGAGARLTGVVTCGMVWTCKVCAGRIAEQRRDELERAIKFHVSTGGHPYLLTLTAPHGRELALREFRRLFGKALQKFKNSKAYKRIRAQYQHAGSVRSLELTWGSENGWHLHSHDLYFAAPGLDGDVRAVDELRGAWVKALLRAGLGDQSKLSWMLEHGLDLRGGQAAADYVTKFGHDAKHGLSAEITRSHAKIGMRKFAELEGASVTPFQILAWASEGDAEACRLFREYAEAMEDARMLYWSPNLKAKLGVADVDDADIAADDEPLPEEKNIAQITGADLALVLSRRALGELLEFVCLVSADFDACVRDFLDALRSRPPTSKGIVRVRKFSVGKRPEGSPAFTTMRLIDGTLKAAQANV